MYMYIYVETFSISAIRHLFHLSTPQNSYFQYRKNYLKTPPYYTKIY